MEILGLVAFVLVMTYSSLPEEIKKLKQSVKKLEKNFMKDVDEEWIKFSTNDKKGRNVTRIMRIEKISEVEVIRHNL